MSKPIKIIDLFAGPGGLGEGFSSLQKNTEDCAFKIALSIENEPSAHQTLSLRAFYRQFYPGQAPNEYYDFLSGELGKYPDEGLFHATRFRKHVSAAKREARCLTLGKDNRTINSAIKDALGARPGPWVLIGGPPCQAYSLVGRSRNRGKSDYRPEEDHRNFLYREYLKVISRFSPAVFVMENVKGLLSAKVDGKRVFDQICEDLKCPAKALKTKDRRQHYEIFPFVRPEPSGDLFNSKSSPSDFIIRSERYGVPQARHRVILLGVRSDFAKFSEPDYIGESASPMLNEIIGDLPTLRSGLSKMKDSPENWIAEVTGGTKALVEAVSSFGLDAVSRKMEVAIKAIKASKLERGSNWLKRLEPKSTMNMPNALRSWYADPSGRSYAVNHDTRGHISKDLHRYLFCACYAEVQEASSRRTPSAKDFPDILAPDHANWKSGNFADRFRVQAADLTPTTVTSHISKDGHYFIHYDPTQCRSITVREAARIQTFPDDYFFVGTRTQQYVQVGNAVPPFLANQLAQTVYGILIGKSG
jgi:DNA (cytosine-5)-methyltransferase 1